MSKKQHQTEEEVLEVENDVPGAEEKSEWQLKAEEYLTDLKRVQADFENYKKRQAESQKELGGYLIEKLVLEIVPVLDNFRAATMHVPEEQKNSPWVTGIQYIEKQLEDVVKQNGVEVIEAKAGDEFDPSIHEAVSHESEEGESDTQVITQVLQNGFRIGDKVIRPAKVSVK
jgi:molecular chaperone GrpE